MKLLNILDFYFSTPRGMPRQKQMAHLIPIILVHLEALEQQKNLSVGPLIAAHDGIADQDATARGRRLLLLDLRVQAVVVHVERFGGGRCELARRGQSGLLVVCGAGRLDDARCDCGRRASEVEHLARGDRGAGCGLRSGDWGQARGRVG